MERNKMLKNKSLLAFFLVATMTVSLPLCARAENLQSVQAVQSEALPSLGEKLWGATVKELGRVSRLSADTILFKHEKSGADILFIKNDDKERSFSITYRTPYVDETDTNHIFEHAVLASSDKYPSKDIFFDVMNGTYNTFANAYTYDTFTSYPVCSQSEEQLMKMADVYLSCMVAPGLMDNENFFKREAIRYELYDKKEPITMTGTVFSEDFGYMTNLNSNANNNMIDTLFPGEYASNSKGRAELNYKDLTYEHTKETYDRCYSFDNSLLIFYGDLDYKKTLEFLDKEYLSKSENKHINLDKYMKEPKTAPGYVEKTIESPAYEGDATENASEIGYGIDVSSYSWDDLMKLEAMCGMLSKEDSLLQKNVAASGITNQIYCYVDTFSLKPTMYFSMLNANENMKKDMKQAIDKTFGQIFDEGFPIDDVEAYMKTSKIYQYLGRNDVQIGVKILPEIASQWTHTGKVDGIGVEEKILESIKNDKEQKIFKALAKRLSKPERSALVVTVPKPGMAEKIEKEKEDYLAQMKASMTDAQLEQMIKDTKKFNEWNESELRNTSFSIPIADLPNPETPGAFTKDKGQDITIYTSEANVDKVALNHIYFDTSTVKQEDLFYITLYELLMSNLDTDAHKSSELKNLESSYLSGLAFSESYPDETAKENHRPMMVATWYCLTEDYEKSIDLLLDMMKNSDFDDSENIINNINKYKYSFDLSKKNNALMVAADYAKAYTDSEQAYKNAISGQELYNFLEDTEKKMKEDPTYCKVVAEKLRLISSSVVTKNKLIAISIADKDALPSITKIAKEKLNALPLGTGVSEKYVFPIAEQKTAVIMERANQANVMSGSLKDCPEFLGRYAPFVSAISDRYITPKVRFEAGAYSAGTGLSYLVDRIVYYSVSGPNVKKTFDIYSGSTDALKNITLTEDELRGYILNAYSEATLPLGVLEKNFENISMDINGIDYKAYNEKIKDIKNATLKDKEAATSAIEKIVSKGSIATAGNQTAIEADKKIFDKVIDLRKK